MTFFYQIIRKYILIFNLFLVLLTSSLLLLSDNITILILNGYINASNIMLTLFLMIIVLLSLIPLNKKSSLNILSLASLIITTGIIIITAIKLYQWFFLTLEGPINFKFITFIKTASFDTKMTYYNQLLNDKLIIIKQNNNHMALFLEKVPFIINPSYHTIMNTPLTDIHTLVAANIDNGIVDYNNMVAQSYSSKWSKKKIAIYTLGVILVLGIVYYMGQNSLSTVLDKKIKLHIASETQSMITENVLQEALNKTAKLSENLNVALKEIKILKNDQEATFKLIQKTLKFITHVAIKAPEQILNMLQQASISDIADYLGRLPPGINYPTKTNT